MKSDLGPAKNVLRSFQVEIEAAMKLQCSISAPTFATSFSVQDRTPDFNTVAFVPQSDASLEKEKAYAWLYAEPWHHRALMHRSKPPQVPEYYQQPAPAIYDFWRSSEKEVFFRGCIIPRPEEVTLIEYLHQLASIITEENEKRVVWIKSFHCFLHFIRQDTDFDQQGTLEVIFPKKMKIIDDYSFKKTEKGIEKVERRCIVRIVDNKIPPIDIFAASDILRNLATTVLNGRPNSQHTAAEALALTWLCHAIGSSQLMTLTREEIIYNSTLDALKFVELKKYEKYFQPECYITIQNSYGPVDVPISNTLYDFLFSLPRKPDSARIFTKAWSSLLRAFYKKGVNASERPRKYGNITFLTFTSRPHENIGHRPGVIKHPSISRKSKTVTHRAI